MDYKKLGFRAGLEIHQQLDTHKLFCKCPSEITDAIDYSFKRYLRPTSSELGEIDEAAIAEAKRQREFFYLAPFNSTCLVEADEEPPHSANEEAIDICLTVAMLLKSKIVDEIHFMRKIVIDGSNTTGFQRTAVVAMGGKIDGIVIETICLEEDAARKIEEEGNVVKYGLDRLGIPLIEITTSPSIDSPEKAEEIAEKIGRLLRATKKVKRGIGTIRQDVNVSIKGGNRVEIKGVQELHEIKKILENEVKRQIELTEVKNLINKRIKKGDVEKEKIVDISSIFHQSKSNLIKKLLDKGIVMGLRLPGFSGLIGGVLYKENRLGRELAVHAKLVGGGIIHSDELPNYGISMEEVQQIKERLGCGNEDAFVISAGEKEIVLKSLEAVKERIMKAFDGVPKEVRRAMPDGLTEYMRPLPGAARMYPETDVPPIFVTEERKKKILSSLPELPDEKIKRFFSYGLSKEEAKQIVYGNKDEFFDFLVRKHPRQAKVISRILLNIIPEMEKEGVEVNLGLPLIEKVLDCLEKRMFAKEGLPSLLHYLSKNPDVEIKDAIKVCGIGYMGEDEIRDVIKSVVYKKKKIVEEKGEKAIPALMGILMNELRGKADGSLIHKILKEEMEKVR